MLNSITLMGRLVADPELRSTQSGAAVCAFRIAVDRDYSGQDGTKQTDFIDIVAWRQTAEFVSRYFSKGKMIVVQGSLQGRKWQEKNGNNRVAWEVIADRVWFGGSKTEGSNSAPQDSGSAPREVSMPSYQSGSEDDLMPLPDDDLPF